MANAFSMYLDDDLKEALAVTAFETGLSQAEIARIALEEKLYPNKTPVPLKKKRSAPSPEDLENPQYS